MKRVQLSIILICFLNTAALAASTSRGGACYLYDASGNPISSTAGALNTSGGGGGGSNAAAGLTGSAVPASTSYTGFNSSGTLVGTSAANPFPVAQQGAVTCNAGTGTFTTSVGNFPANQTVSWSGQAVSISGTPTVTVSSGTVTSNDGGTKITAATIPAGGVGLTGWMSAIYQQLLATLNVSATQSGPWTVTTTPPSNASTNVAQFGGTNISTGTGAGGAGIPRFTVSNDSTLGLVAGTTVGITNAAAVAKGTQGANGLPTQDLKDAGRTMLRFYANGVASGATGVETAITLTKSSGTAATSTGTSFVITSGKTFRITQFIFGSRGNATATAQISNCRIRINTAGAVVTTSTPVIYDLATATPATASAWDRVQVQGNEGDEIAGNGTIQFGVTCASVFVTNAPTWFIFLAGYEY